jgi:nucleotide-binding universal stress UspA family protein
MAVDLAREHDAHLTGLCPLDLMLLPANLGFEPAAGFAESAVLQLLVTMGAEARERALPIETRFRDELRRNELKGEWRLVEGPAAEVVTRHAQSADIVILGQNDPDDPPPQAGRQLVERVLVGSGRPVLIIPYAGQFELIGRRIVVGWNGSREATRAVLMQPNAVVTILSVAENEPPGTRASVPSADIADHLARYGFRVTVANAVSDDVASADLLLNQASDMTADLMITGGYGHSRLREIIMGGVTRALLKTTTVPVLMSH